MGGGWGERNGERVGGWGGGGLTELVRVEAQLGSLNGIMSPGTTSQAGNKTHRTYRGCCCWVKISAQAFQRELELISCFSLRYITHVTAAESILSVAM